MTTRGLDILGRWRQTTIRLVVVSGVFMTIAVVCAENIDPGNDASQYAYAENIGWLNAEPSGDGGPGIQVNDFQLTGWMWGENIGWLSLSCENTVSCGPVDYGVVNDGGGVLSGYAWGENVGWINFAPSTAGVLIDPSSGDFNGRAWGENIGWITFASTGANPYKVTTSWSCDPVPPVPVESATLAVDRSGNDVLLSWNGIVGASGYDVVRGDLDLLRTSDGDFGKATDGCVENNVATTLTVCPGTACVGDGLWFLVRAVNCSERVGIHGPYETGEPSQVDLRDAEILGSGNDCP